MSATDFVISPGSELDGSQRLAHDIGNKGILEYSAEVSKIFERIGGYSALSVLAFCVEPVDTLFGRDPRLTRSSLACSGLTVGIQAIRLARDKEFALRAVDSKPDESPTPTLEDRFKACRV